MRTSIWTSSTPRPSAEVTLRIVDSIASVPAQQWNALETAGNPFVRHEFLLTLERTGCVGELLADDSTDELSPDHALGSASSEPARAAGPART